MSVIEAVESVNASWNCNFVRAESRIVAWAATMLDRGRQGYLDHTFSAELIAGRITLLKESLWESEYRAVLLHYDVADSAGLLAFLTR